MYIFNSMSRSALAVLTAIFFILSVGCSNPADTNNAKARANPAARTKEQSKLGELTEFSSIATDVSSMVNHGELSAAKTRIKELEVTWDSAEAGLKPRAVDDWHVLDHAIDNALSALRASNPNQAGCQKAMAELMNTFQTLQNKI